MKQNISLKYKSLASHSLLNLFVKLFISFWAVWHISRHKDLYFVSQSFTHALSPFIGFLFLFSLLNWYFEIKKWQSLVISLSSINFWEAARQSLTSFSVSLVTPNRVGEYGAKALFFPRQQRKKILFLNLAGNLSQLSISLILGFFGLIYLYLTQAKSWDKIIKMSSISRYSISIIILIILLAIIIVFFLIKKFFAKNFKSCPCIKTLGYSIIRYIIFSSQFALLWSFLHQYEINFDLFSAILITYLIASIIPALSFFDWAIKGSTAAFVFPLFHLSIQHIILTTSLMWLMNFFIPFLLGIVLFLWNPKTKENV